MPNGSKAPTRKVTAGLLSTFVLTIVVWAAKQYASTDIPAEVAVAGAGILNFGLQYFIKDAE